MGRLADWQNVKYPLHVLDPEYSVICGGSTIGIVWILEFLLSGQYEKDYEDWDSVAAVCPDCWGIVNNLKTAKGSGLYASR